MSAQLFQSSLSGQIDTWHPYLKNGASLLRLVLIVNENFFSCFFVFVVCRFCTSKQSFGYLLIDLARWVFVKVFVRDWPKTKFWLESFLEAPDLPKPFKFWELPKLFKFWELPKLLPKHLQCYRGCLDFAMPLGLSNCQIYFTILAIYHLRPSFIV
jgi:hypothetical protein